LLSPPLGIIVVAEQESATPCGRVESHSPEVGEDTFRKKRKMSPIRGTRNAYGKIQQIPFSMTTEDALVSIHNDVIVQRNFGNV
jgi:hypothetical protein